jgi:outer membrane protein assembly factor BamB
MVVLLFTSACGKPRVVPPAAPFPPKSRWEKPLTAPLSGPLATDGTLVFSASSDGSVTALDPVTGIPVWTRPGASEGFVVARPGAIVFVEKTGVAWGLEALDGSARWKNSTNVTGVSSVRLDLNRVFIGGASGFAALVASTGETHFDLPAKDVADLDVSGDWLAAREEGALVVRARESGAVRFRLASPEGGFGAPAVFPDGRVVLGSGDRIVRAISPDGDLRWRFKVGARVRDRPLDYADGKRVGVLSFEGVFYELSVGGGDMRRRVLLASRPFGAPVLIDGRIWAPIFEDEIAVIDEKTAKLIARTRYGGSFLSQPVLVGGRVLAEIAGPRRIVALETIPKI